MCSYRQICLCRTTVDTASRLLYASEYALYSMKSVYNELEEPDYSYTYIYIYILLIHIHSKCTYKYSVTMELHSYIELSIIPALLLSVAQTLPILKQLSFPDSTHNQLKNAYWAYWWVFIIPYLIELPVHWYY